MSVVCGCGVSGPGGSEFLVGLLVGVSNPLFSVSVCWVSLCPPVRSLQYRVLPSGVFGVCWLCVASGRCRCSLVADVTAFGCVRFCCAPGLGGPSRGCLFPRFPLVPLAGLVVFLSLVVGFHLYRSSPSVSSRSCGRCCLGLLGSAGVFGLFVLWH